MFSEELSHNQHAMAITSVGQHDPHRPTVNARLRRAVELKFAQPSVSWSDLAKQIGCGRKTLWVWRQSEEWEACWRDLANEHMTDLVPHAMRALIRAFNAGTAPREALEVLRGYGLLAPQAVHIHETAGIDIDDVRARVLGKLAAIHERATDDDSVRRLPESGDVATGT